MEMRRGGKGGDEKRRERWRWEGVKEVEMGR